MINIVKYLGLPVLLLSVGIATAKATNGDEVVTVNVVTVEPEGGNNKSSNNSASKYTFTLFKFFTSATETQADSTATKNEDELIEEPVKAPSSGL